MKSSRAWSYKGKQQLSTTLMKAPLHSIIGAISSTGVINLTMPVPKAPPNARRIQGGKKRKAPDAVFGKEEHRVQLLTIM